MSAGESPILRRKNHQHGPGGTVLQSKAALRQGDTKSGQSAKFTRAEKGIECDTKAHPESGPKAGLGVGRSQATSECPPR